MRRKAFTLIELLVVIAIIAILAAILFPVFAKAREKARASACTSNLKQVGLAIMQYTNDYDESYPQGRIGGNGAHLGVWQQLITPYMKNIQVFTCQSNTNGAKATQWDANPAFVPPVLPGCYLGSPRVMNYGAAMAMSAINAPANKAMVWEGIANSTGGWSTGMHADWAGAGSAIVTTGWSGHNSMMGVIYCDGHVKLLKPTALMGPNWNMIGGFWDNYGGQANYPGDNVSINQDAPSPGAQTAFAALEAKYN